MTISIPCSEQRDEALRLLADLYARRSAGQPTRPGDQVIHQANTALMHALREATSQEDAHRRLITLLTLADNPHVQTEADALAWTSTIEKACAWLAQVIVAHGDARVLLAGETDGFRHLCRSCCQDEGNFTRIRFFNISQRRPLLKAEVCNATRSLYGKCQICQQVLAPIRYVVLTPLGTVRHVIGCPCGHCNRAARAHVGNLYEQDQTSGEVLLPRVAQLAAPSPRQLVTRALAHCWEQGWYLLFHQPAEH